MFVLGLVVGSFLNVCIWRMPRAESVVHPPSHCCSCGTRLRAVDLVPVLSFLAQGRKCRYCRAPISWRYAIVETITGVAFAGLVYVNGGIGGGFVFDAVFVAALIPIVAVDIERLIIPNELNWAVFLSGMARGLWGLSQGSGSYAFLVGAVVAWALFAGIGMLGQLLFKREAMGMGDIKLAPGIGAHLGWMPALAAFFLAVLFGAVVGLAQAGISFLRSGKHKPFRYIPFGPYMVLGAAAVVYAGQWVVPLFLRIYSLYPPDGASFPVRSWP